ncbi:chromate efflux transporter [Thalassomonas sp. RHCl1]|uniref:chromate efflux transporter n=1 Tax=Thalassomonas sp. RHCl1 TaxID=2995320 RepID=UPI00248CDD87|nr:chromate efflux transporter [Thalassomonas sp. RHCl1]
MWSIFKTFFFLGWISFGGPAAHIGYFRKNFVEKLKWLNDSEYAQLVALSQFLPGPGSSQVGFALGYKRGGLGGACSAFLGFTLPSVLLMLMFAVISNQIADSDLYASIVRGLKLLAVVVVADATWGMYKNFCQSELTAGLCVVTATIVLLMPGVGTQMLVLALAGGIGCCYLKGKPVIAGQAFKPSLAPLVIFVLLLFALPLIAHHVPMLALFSDFFYAGSLVFGGGHVVLPLLQELLGNQISRDSFLTGYVAAQAVPGPMFTLATYIGYEVSATPIFGALVATLGIFLPGFLLLLAVLRNWQTLAEKPCISGAMLGVNASVVGLLLAALYQPVFSSAVSSPTDIALVIIGVYLMRTLNLSVLWMIVFFISCALVI